MLEFDTGVSWPSIADSTALGCPGLTVIGEPSTSWVAVCDGNATRRPPASREPASEPTKWTLLWNRTWERR